MAGRPAPQARCSAGRFHLVLSSRLFPRQQRGVAEIAAGLGSSDSGGGGQSPTEPATSVCLGWGSRGEGALLLAGVQEDLIGILRVWGSRVSVVCAPALLAKEQEKANSGLSDRKPDVGRRWTVWCRGVTCTWLEGHGRHGFSERS